MNLFMRNNETAHHMSRKLLIAVDFDGTVVTHDYPKIGESVNAESILKRLVEKGHTLVMGTKRVGAQKEEAYKWFEERDIPIQKTSTRDADMTIDDSAVGAPVTNSAYWTEGTRNFSVSHSKPFINWFRIKMQLEGQGVI